MLSRFPVRPWTKQISIVASGQACHSLMPSGNGGERSDVVGLGGSEVDGDRRAGEATSLLRSPLKRVLSRFISADECK